MTNFNPEVEAVAAHISEASGVLIEPIHVLGAMGSSLIASKAVGEFGPISPQEVIVTGWLILQAGLRAATDEDFAQQIALIAEAALEGVH